MVTVRQLIGWAALALLGGMSVGCGGSGAGGSGSVATFPSREQLQEITSQPPPARQRASGPTVSVSSWELAPAEASAQNPLLQGPERSLRASPELGCAAREIGRFVTEKSG